MIKKIGILTSGGDAPGMNNAIVGVLNYATVNNIEVYGIKDGYKGLVNNQISKLDNTIVDNIINKGGTVLGSARLVEFKEEKVREIAIKNLKEHEIEALIVIGGD